jgi:surface protein
VQKTNNRKKIIKVRRQGGITLKAAPGAKIGDTEVIDGEVYTIRSEAQLRDLIRQKKYDDVRRTCTSFIRTMSNMFASHKTFNKPIGHWDTHNVINMRRMFSSAYSFNQPIGTWDTSNVRDMTLMFYSAKKFNNPIGNWNTTKVKNMEYMFYEAFSFNQPIDTWNIRNVTNMLYMFRDSGFRQDISTWEEKLHPNVKLDPETRARIIKPLNITRAQLAFAEEFHTNAQDPVYFKHVPFNRAHILVPELIKHNNVHKIRRVYDTNTVNRSIRPSMKSPFTRASLHPGDIIKLSTIANKLVPQRGNRANKRRLKNQYERIMVESKLRDVIEQINSITKRKIPNDAKKTILNGSNLPKQRAMLEKKLRNMP